MSEPKWIPGPYVVDNDYRAGMSYNRHIVLDRDPNMRLCFMAHDGEVGDVAFKATAQLFAAAPDLYAACVAARQQIAFDLEGAAGAAMTLSEPGYGPVARSLDQRREIAEGVLQTIDAALAAALGDAS